MNSGKNRSISFIFLVLFIGIIIGAILSQLVGGILPEGVVKDFFLTSSPPSPLERTYLTTGILEAAMLSNNRSGEIVKTPYLDISYVPFEKSVRRPEGVLPSGASTDSFILPEPGKSHTAVSVPISNDGTVRNEQH